ncbi:MAG: hypothetical protein ACM3TR_21100 [Caulobacteraceae bacterium]
MSLQVGFNENNYINYNANKPELTGGAVQKAPEADNAGGQTPTVGNNEEAKLMKRLGLMECSTCRNRKYVDGSSDPGVSFKAPAHVSPESSGTAVMAHEQEHVSREGSKAKSEARVVVAQSVQIYTDVCPECGRVYTSGGKTTTTTKSESGKSDYFMNNMKKFFENHYGKYIDMRL